MDYCWDTVYIEETIPSTWRNPSLKKQMISKVQKTINATKWSAIERLTVQFIQLIISIIIARLLLPTDFGIIGMVVIFLGISQTFIDSGFSQALIYKSNRTSEDSSTVFYFNIIVGILCYIIIYIASPYVAKFYNMPILTSVTRVISLSIPISAFSIVQRALLTADSDFKTQTRASIPAVILSGSLGILLAYLGYGVWALVWQQLLYVFVNTALLWFFFFFRPIFLWSWTSFKEFFSYGSKLLVSGLIDTIYNNLYLLVIGKFFKAYELGLYTKAKTFPYFASVNLSSIFQRASFPVLCELKENNKQLVNAYRRYFKISISITTPIVLGFCALASPIVKILLGDNWVGCVPLMQILCFFYLLSPIVMLNNNIYQVKGETSTFLKLEIIKKLVGVSILIVSVPLGLYAVCVGSVISSLISLGFNMYFSSRIIPLTIKNQLIDTLSVFVLAFIASIPAFISSYLIANPISAIVIGFVAEFVTYFAVIKIFNQNLFSELTSVLSKLKNKSLLN